MLTSATFVSLLITGVALAAPLLLAALGELIAEKAGVINVGIEGMVLAGAFAGFTGAYYTHSPVLGAAAAMAAAVTLAAIFAAITVGARADQVVAGTAINILALGLTGVLYRALFSTSGASVPGFEPWSVPILHRLPLIGAALFNQNAIAYLAWLLVPVTWYFLARTLPGLRLRAVGEYPAAADVAGVRVPIVRIAAVLWGGALAGLAGAYLSIAYTNGFVENMSAGRGFIALAVVILGRWKAGGVAFAALLFGVASALQFQFQATTTAVPYQFFLALPYILTLCALLLRASGRIAGPAALGSAYVRG
jgi:ABC-type uncharacterized transport system permease subunit